MIIPAPIPPITPAATAPSLPWASARGMPAPSRVIVVIAIRAFFILSSLFCSVGLDGVDARLFSRQEELREPETLTMNVEHGTGMHRRKRRIPRTFKELTPSNHFNPRTFFYEMIWKGWFTPRGG